MDYININQTAMELQSINKAMHFSKIIDSPVKNMAGSLYLIHQDDSSNLCKYINAAC